MVTVLHSDQSVAVMVMCVVVMVMCRYSRGMDRRDYYSRSRSADQRALVDRPIYARSRSTDRADSAHVRSGRSAPPSPALTR